MYLLIYRELISLYDFREKETGMFAKTIKISAWVLVVSTIIFTLFINVIPIS